MKNRRVSLVKLAFRINRELVSDGSGILDLGQITKTTPYFPFLNFHHRNTAASYRLPYTADFRWYPVLNMEPPVPKPRPYQYATASLELSVVGHTSQSVNEKKHLSQHTSLHTFEFSF
ncbi:hypothetical protein AVEN_162129-1 [Araneus ventricosus]|uniref:Uncharacterized protein n=1 Tax=Araneus ventricosus TaxID=182803 RepID=A0A4Y2NUG6_ARAVE|nr:hypothetical protein AVEN_162129-1 [Araneus ventricosus]